MREGGKGRKERGKEKENNTQKTLQFGIGKTLNTEMRTMRLSQDYEQSCGHAIVLISLPNSIKCQITWYMPSMALVP